MSKLDYGKGAKLPSGHRVLFLEADLEKMWLFEIADMDGNTLGKAYVVSDPAIQYPVLVDILVFEESRGAGVGDELMGVLTDAFDNMLTGMSSEAGRGLCIKHGWKFERTKDQPSHLRWEKPDAERSSTDSEPGSISEDNEGNSQAEEAPET